MGIYVGDKRYALFVGSTRRKVAERASAEYIQDGLIAWYDGEWNEDIGVHNSSATKWVNLADKGKDITGIDSNFTWGDDYLLPPATAAVGSIPGLYPTTIEAVLNIGGTGFIPLLTLSYPDLWISIRGNNTVNFFNGGYYANVQRGAKLALSAPGLRNGSSAKNPSAIYINGVDSIIKQGGGTLASYTRNTFNSIFSYGSGTAYWYCIRFYNRELTEAEIMNNWKIDKKRFGL